MTRKPQRDIESGYTNAEFVAKLRRLADAIESGGRFDIQIAGERIYVPASAGPQRPRTSASTLPASRPRAFSCIAGR